VDFEGCRALNKCKDNGEEGEFCQLAEKLIAKADKADMDFIIAICDVHKTAKQPQMAKAMINKSEGMKGELSYVSNLRIGLIKEIQEQDCAKSSAVSNQG
jgi:hypothetical protein